MVLLSGTFVGGIQALVRLQFGIDAEMQVPFPPSSPAQHPPHHAPGEIAHDDRALRGIQSSAVCRRLLPIAWSIPRRHIDGTVRMAKPLTSGVGPNMQCQQKVSQAVFVNRWR